MLLVTLQKIGDLGLETCPNFAISFTVSFASETPRDERLQDKQGFSALHLAVRARKAEVIRPAVLCGIYVDMKPHYFLGNPRKNCFLASFQKDAEFFE